MTGRGWVGHHGTEIESKATKRLSANQSGFLQGTKYEDI